MPQHIATATAPGDAAAANEDHIVVRDNVVIVLDGLTTRTETGCVHGVPWHVAHLAEGMLTNVDAPLSHALFDGIGHVSDLHRNACDLSHSATPSAAVAALRVGEAETEYLVLGDATIVIESDHHRCRVISDHRIRRSAAAERAEADLHPIGSTAKQAAMVYMKRAELNVRNTPYGYWVAAADPTVAGRCIIGAIPTPEVRRAVVATDGAARLVDDFGLMTWGDVLDMAATAGPGAAIRAVRHNEERDPLGIKWPRNKKSDDASLAYICVRRTSCASR